MNDSTRFCLIVVLTSAVPLVAAEGRITMPLDGTWDIEDSVSPEGIPAKWTHKAPVPGLANLARPVFPDVDRFDSRELINNKIRRKLLPESDRTQAAGVSRQTRNYFWYRTTFRPSARKSVAILRVNKAQFTTAVWINGKPAGEHSGCFTAGIFDLTKYVSWDEVNDLVVRIGAHPGVVREPTSKS
jgi:beta-galactosidase